VPGLEKTLAARFHPVLRDFVMLAAVEEIVAAAQQRVHFVVPADPGTIEARVEHPRLLG